MAYVHDLLVEFVQGEHARDEVQLYTTLQC